MNASSIPFAQAKPETESQAGAASETRRAAVTAGGGGGLSESSDS
jgi:hypothetical protein